jgi:hypothetical protein
VHSKNQKTWTNIRGNIIINMFMATRNREELQDGYYSKNNPRIRGKTLAG